MPSVTKKEAIQLLTAEFYRFYEKNQYCKSMGMEIVLLEPGHSITRMKMKPELENPFGFIHGGALYSLADTSAGGTCWLWNNLVTTISGTLNFLRPAVNTEYVYCESTCIRRGRSVIVYDIRIRDDRNEVLDSGEFIYHVMERPVIEDLTITDEKG